MGVKKGEQIGKHNEERTENTRKCNLQEQKTKVYQKLTERKRWRMKEKPGSGSRIFVATFFDY